MTNDELTSKEAATLLKVSQRTVQRMIERGSLHARRSNDPRAEKANYRLSRAEVEKLLRAQLDK